MTRKRNLHVQYEYNHHMPNYTVLVSKNLIVFFPSIFHLWLVAFHGCRTQGYRASILITIYQVCKRTFSYIFLGLFKERPSYNYKCIEARCHIFVFNVN